MGQGSGDAASADDTEMMEYMLYSPLDPHPDHTPAPPAAILRYSRLYFWDDWDSSLEDLNKKNNTIIKM